MPKIVFVDNEDVMIGAGTRQEALERGIAHRIVRILLFNSAGHLLVQKRAAHVLSLPGRWDQSAAGHVEEGETYLQAAYREMEEEIGVTGIWLNEEFKYYSVETDEVLPKKRFNMVYTCIFDGHIIFNPEEVADTRWISPTGLRDWMSRREGDFTQGFRNCFHKYSALRN